MRNPVYVIAGQSNAVGVIDYNGLGEYISNYNVDASIISNAVGGTGMFPRDDKLDWSPHEDGDPETGELTSQLIEKIDESLSSDPNNYLAGVLWIQGETDASHLHHALLYQSRLQSLVDLLTGNYGQGFTFMISKLYDGMVWNTGTQGQEAVASAQVAVAAENTNVSLLDPTQVFENGAIDPANVIRDQNHFNNTGADAIAYAFMDQFYVHDTEDRKSWSSYTDHFDFDGQKDGRTVYFDDGRVYQTTYADGIRSQRLGEDVDDAHNFVSFVEEYDAEGQRESRTVVYDNGRSVQTVYEQGMRTEITVSDVEDARSWLSYTDYFDFTGVRSARAMSYDDGRVYQTTYVNGIRSERTGEDVADAYNYASFVDTYDAGGDRVSRLMTYDDGREVLTSFVDDLG